MTFRKIKPHKMTEDELRKIWQEEYCDQVIHTFDNILVKFYQEMFDHVFYESSSRKTKDKAIISLNRLEKIYWIKETLMDPDAILKKGWDAAKKDFYKDRRVAIVKENYIVIIRFTGLLKARFVTAYEKDDISKILNSPDFERSERFFGKQRT